MTNEQAIHLLHRLQDEQFDGIHGDERREALEMAVRALEGDGDTISRKATMIVIENSGLDDDSKDTVVRVLEQLPPARPEPKWIPCSERLPSKSDHKDDMVLVCYGNGSIRFNTYMNGWTIGNPIAWMPLPKPYGGESE